MVISSVPEALAVLQKVSVVTVPAVDVCLHPSANKPVVAVHLAVLQSASFASITQKPVIIGKLAKPVDVAVVLFVFIFIIEY